jgi:hypothetical protein
LILIQIIQNQKKIQKEKNEENFAKEENYKENLSLEMNQLIFMPKVKEN